MRKKGRFSSMLLITLVILMCFSMSVPVSSADGFVYNGRVKVQLDGVPLLECRSLMETNGILLVPLQRITEKMGLEARWDSSDSSMTLAGEEQNIIKLWPGKTDAHLDNRMVVRFGSAPVLRLKTVYAPLDMLRALTGYDISYNKFSKTLNITNIILDKDGEKLYETARLKIISNGVERSCKNPLYIDREDRVLISEDDFKNVTNRAFLSTISSPESTLIGNRTYYSLCELAADYGLAAAVDRAEKEVRISLAAGSKVQNKLLKEINTLNIEDEKIALSGAVQFDSEGKYLDSLTEAVLPVSEYKKIDPELQNIKLITKGGKVEKDTDVLVRGDYYIVNEYVFKVSEDAVPLDMDGVNCRQGWISPSEADRLFYEANRIRENFGSSVFTRNDSLLDKDVRKEAGDEYNISRDTVRKNAIGVFSDIQGGNMPNTYHILGKMVNFNEYYVYAQYTYQLPNDWVNVLLSSEGHRQLFTDETASEGSCLMLRSPEGWGLSVYSSNAPGIWTKKR